MLTALQLSQMSREDKLRVLEAIMRIKILHSAIDDLHSGRLFYERQVEGLGEYFFDSIFADID
jgi:hypothetical protein